VTSPVTSPVISLDPLLLDTQLLLWWAAQPERLPPLLLKTLEDPERPVLFSVVSLWEVAIKTSLGRSDFQVDGAALRHGLLTQGFIELPIKAEHALGVQQLPWIHRDPFDRLLVAVAKVEGLTLLTTDESLAGYGQGIRTVP